MKKLTILLCSTICGAGLVLEARAQPTRNLSGTVLIDGSSTVYPITEAVAYAFNKVSPRVRVPVGISGTGGGFKRFTAGEIDISDASRPIKKKEHDAAVANGVEYIELPIAYDGLTIVVNPKNDWLESLSVGDLRRIFLDGSQVSRWSDLDPSYPDVPLRIYAPGTDSGTFDYFKEVVAGKKGAIRDDMQVSEDDNVLVRGVAGDEGAIGFFGCAYYYENQELIRAVPIQNESSDAVLPTPENVESGSYSPFSRPLFIYVNKASANKPQVRAFVEFYLKSAGDMAANVGYVALPKDVYGTATRKWRSRETGTVFLDEAGNRRSDSLTVLYQ